MSSEADTFGNIRRVGYKLKCPYITLAFSKCFFNIRIEIHAPAKLVITVNASIEQYTGHKKIVKICDNITAVGRGAYANIACNSNC